MSHTKEFRRHQKEADDAIYHHLVSQNQSKCLVKMFCGTGKSLLMRKCKVAKDKNLCVYVFSSLGLVEQFCKEYLSNHKREHLLKICSEIESTTNPATIQRFVSTTPNHNKIICTTYQSFKTLVDNLDGVMIDVCFYDEAHNAVGETYQNTIFNNDYCVKQVFMTATPVNRNGITMLSDEKSGDCGDLVYEYTYLQALCDEYVNPFEIRIDMFTENTNKSVYDCIARAILASGNSRVLTFHGSVNGDTDTCVNNFVDNAMFQRCFREVQQTEFPEKRGYYKKIDMVGLTSTTVNRNSIFDLLETTQNDEVIVVSSCQVLREGIDTKRANMCVFVDPKSSLTQIIQNIGRVLRPSGGISTILLPCWVDREKYLACGGDREKCDEVIREDMGESGNFNGILNVLSALKQEDEEIYDICLHYTDTYSPQEIENHLSKQGFHMMDPVDDEGDLVENLGYMLDDSDFEVNIDEYETDEDLLMGVAEEKDVCIEIHSNSLETPIETYNSECESGDVVRLFKSVDEETGDTIYQPIVPKNGKKKRTQERSVAPDRKNRMKVNVHVNPDIKVLWNIVGDIDMSKDICSCIIDCEVVKELPMDRAISIVERANNRILNGEDLLPKRIRNSNQRKNASADKKQEHSDYQRLADWKNPGKKCPIQVIDYLDVHLDSWRTKIDFEANAMNAAKKIVERAEIRRDTIKPTSKKDNWWYPRNKSKNTLPNDIVRIQEDKDAKKLSRFMNILNGSSKCGSCPDSVKEYLDTKLPGWRKDNNELSLELAKAIVERANIRKQNKQLEEENNKNTTKRRVHWWIPCRIDDIKKRNTKELKEEHSDAVKLGNLRQALRGSKNSKITDDVCKYLDENLYGWRKVEYYKQSREERNLYKNEWKKNKKNKNDTVIHENITKVIKKKSMKLCAPSSQPSHTTHSECPEPRESTKQRAKSQLTQLHQRYKHMTSNTLTTFFHENPDKWHEYHDISEKNEESFPQEEIPRNIIIRDIDTTILSKRTKEVIDLGCGMAYISKHFSSQPSRFHFTNCDVVACDDTVSVCDINHLTAYDDHSFDICILSLALWCTNREDSIKEAYRVLDRQGILYVAEATKKWSELDDCGNIVPGKEACKLISMLERNGFRVKPLQVEKFCIFVCMKI